MDDIRNFLRPLLHGVRWSGEHFFYREDWEDEDLKLQLSDQQRTRIELVAEMTCIVSFLNFEGEESEMFRNRRLPTLDTEIWIDTERVLSKYSFYEMETCPNIVL